MIQNPGVKVLNYYSISDIPWETLQTEPFIIHTNGEIPLQNVPLVVTVQSGTGKKQHFTRHRFAIPLLVIPKQSNLTFSIIHSEAGIHGALLNTVGVKPLKPQYTLQFLMADLRTQFGRIMISQIVASSHSYIQNSVA